MIATCELPPPAAPAPFGPRLLVTADCCNDGRVMLAVGNRYGLPAREEFGTPEEAESIAFDLLRAAAAARHYAPRASR